MKLSEAFTKRLEELLKERNENQHHFCTANGIGRSTLDNLKYGFSKSPRLSTIFEVSDALGITPQEFLNSPLFDLENIELE